MQDSGRQAAHEQCGLIFLKLRKLRVRVMTLVLAMGEPPGVDCIIDGHQGTGPSDGIRLPIFNDTTDSACK